MLRQSKQSTQFPKRTMASPSLDDSPKRSLQTLSLDMGPRYSPTAKHNADGTWMGVVLVWT